MKHKRYVLYSEEWGVFVGEALGMGFWSKADPVGQTEVVVFEDPAEADPLIGLSTFTTKPRLVEVQVENPRYATIAECVAAGLPAWDPS